jgi:hypothetical protein
MRRKKQLWGLLAFVVLATYVGCRKPYDPPAISAPNSFLVVEGAINSGADSTIIHLSRTVNLSNVNTPDLVTGATVVVEGDQNTTYPLQEISAGKYVTVGLNLDNSHKYRLSIKAGSSQYVSDYVAVLNSPPIDSIHYQITSKGLNILSNTHDPKNLVKYYRWDYGETWIIHSNFSSGYYSNGDTVLVRPISMQISTCYSRDSSSTIIINSSAKLSSNEIVDNPITSIPSSSIKLGSEYSILVRQYALSADAYTFWTNLKKNTEQLGSIFDPQPSQINGNIHSLTNPNEAVIGYISVGTTSTARIFVRNQQLPAWVTTLPYPDCKLDTFLYKYIPLGLNTPVNQVDLFINYNKGATSPEIPVAGINPPGGPIIGYSAAQPICVDCTLRGSNVEPAFWKF